MSRSAADEEYREGYSAKHDKLIVRLPFKDAGIDKAGVLEILEGAGLGLPEYYEWRTRSGCTFCFFQQKIEWVRLMERHPKFFEEAKAYEKNAVDHGSPFTWSQGESLEALSKPDRVAQIKKNHRLRLERMRSSYQPNPLRPDGEPIDIDDLYGKAESVSRMSQISRDVFGKYIIPPGLALQTLLRQAKPAGLRKLIGASTANILEGLDPDLVTGRAVR